ncbi:MAG: aminotransferase class I/II-fold pyridoxal phosphate-dependent enzyme [Lachnospiraceae bacterium]
MQAIILAAGMGKRLKELTSNATKCMVEVNGKTMIERALASLDRYALSRIVLVVGYEADKLKAYIETLPVKTPVVFVENTVYNTTNNIYSLYLAKEYMLEEDTLLLESDIIFEDRMLDRLLKNPYPTLALVANYESWMDGTVVTLDDENNITRFISKKEFDFNHKDEYFKTVNIYKFSKEFSEGSYVPFLEAYCKALGHNEYYEQVLKVITLLDQCELKACPLEDEKWYEIDDVQDLDIAETIFASGAEKLHKIQSRYGGYWRYERLKDFCYLVNPYYPCTRLKEELKAGFDTLLCEYPSGMSVNSLLAAKYFGLKQEQICVGNGAAELIKAYMSTFKGSTGVVYPTFEEYPNRMKAEEIVAFYPNNADYSYTAEELMEFFEDKDIEQLVIINPDNPSGSFIEGSGIYMLADWCRMRNIRLLLDESFVDFAEIDSEGQADQNSFLKKDILKEYRNLVVVKSISKSFGVPGLRLGVLASSDEMLIRQIRSETAIWNINSFAEFYLQIAEKYTADYAASLVEIRESRRRLFTELSEIKSIRPVRSSANYILCELLPEDAAAEAAPQSAEALTIRLLEDADILIKDCSKKKGFEGKNYIRIAVRNDADNTQLCAALRRIVE